MGGPAGGLSLGAEVRDGRAGWEGFLARRPLLLRVSVVGAAGMYALLLHGAYRDFIAPLFAYLGYRYQVPGPAVLLATVAFAAGPAALLPVGARRPSTVVAWFLYLLAYVPSALIPVVSLVKPYGELLPLQASLLAGMALVAGACRAPRVSIRPARMSPPGFTLVFLGAAAVMYLALVWSMGARFKPPSLEEIYGVRMEQRAAAATAGVVVYTISWLAKVVNPCLIVWGLVRRQWTILLLGLGGQIFMFVQGGQKGMLFVLPLLFGVDWAIRRTDRIFGLSAVAGVAALVLSSLIVDSLSGANLVSSLLVRRAIVIPGMLTGYYFDFFSTNPYALYGHSFLRLFVDYPYPSSPPFLIGLHYFGNPQISANANVWADGFANLGHLGIVLHSAILGSVLWFIDCLARPFERRMALLLILAPAYAMVDSALFTSLLTHGLGLLALVMWATPPSMAHRES